MEVRMEINRIVNGIGSLDLVIAIHQEIIARDLYEHSIPGTNILATILRKDGEQRSYRVEDKSRIRSVSNNEAAQFVVFHNCNDACYTNPDYIPAIGTRGETIDYGGSIYDLDGLSLNYIKKEKF